MTSGTPANSSWIGEVIRKIPKRLLIILLCLSLLITLSLTVIIIYAVIAGRSVSIWVVTIGEQKDSLAERSVMLSKESLTGEWVWSYAEGGWKGSFIFSNGKDDKPVFHGTVLEYKLGNEKNLFSISDGKAWITKDGLHFECNARNLENDQVLHWETVDPLKIGVFFEGSFKSTSSPNSPHSMWGISIRKPFNLTIIPKS